MRTDIAWIRQQMQVHRGCRLEDAGRRRAAVALIFRPVLRDTEVLFILRAEHPRDPWSGHVAFPGGRVDAGDANPQATAEREVREELGIDLLESASCVGSLDEVITTARGRVQPLIITPYAFELTSEVTPIPNEEVQRVLWFRVTDLLRPESTGTHRYVYRDQEVLLPCFRLNGQTIWGLTYHILTRLFCVVQWRVGSQAEGQPLGR
jgi:8-oxo-dGTP pyrophosphatase MutT (NUDIX family)